MIWDPKERTQAVYKAAREREEAVWTELTKRLKATKRKVRIDEPRSSTTDWRHVAIDGVLIRVEVRSERQRGVGSYYGPNFNGKVRVVVGDYGDVRQFPQRKNGHDYDAIVDEILRRVDACKAADHTEGRRQIALDAIRPTVERLQKLAVGCGARLEPQLHWNHEKQDFDPVHEVHVELELYARVEDVAELLQLASRVGQGGD